MWNALDLFKIRPRLAYLHKEDGQKPILVVIDENGFIENVGAVIDWQRIMSMIDGFYKIDNFKEEEIFSCR